jgi:glycosyltransferase involved in cell wall biosynthesis
MKKLRILVGADVPPDPNSGAAGTVYHTNNALREIGHEVDEIWAHDIGRRIKHGNLHYLIELPFRYRTIVAKKCINKKYDIIQLSQPHAYLAASHHKLCGYRSVFVNRSHGIEPMVNKAVDIWNKKLNIPNRPFIKRIISHIIRKLLERHLRLVIRDSDGIIVGASDNAEFLQNKLHAEKNKIAVIPHGISNKFINHPQRPMTKNRLKRILYVGQFSFFKGPHILARTISKCLSDQPGTELAWVCSEVDHKEAIALFNSGIRHRVKMVDELSQEQLIEIYDKYGIFIFSSFFEGFGKTPLEAMSRGLCVVSTRVGGMRDYISNGKNGFLIKPGDSDTMSLRISELINNLDLAERISQNARKDACTYTWKNCAQLSELFYQYLIERKTKFKSDD